MTDDTENLGHPSQTTNLFGHDAAERLFLEAYNSDRLHHAWLIGGPKGVGKATLAWRIAKFLLSEPADEGDSLFGDPLPKDAATLDRDSEDPLVQRIASGGHGGLKVIERSINEKTGKLRNDIVIDDVRSLIRFYEQTSAEGGWRVAIIDAVDEMNTNAANALLKVLEEPPEKSILLLVAHSPGRLLPTIRSRCRPLSLGILQDTTVQAVLAERFPDMSVSELTIAAQLAAGAPGRAIELVEKNGVSLYQNFLGLISYLPRLKLPDVHAFADKVANNKADAEYRLFIELYLSFIQKIARQFATQTALSSSISEESDLINQISPQARLDQWLDLWEKVGDLTKRADSVNLDRKQVVLTMFTSLKALTA